MKINLKRHFQREVLSGLFDRTYDDGNSDGISQAGQIFRHLYRLMSDTPWNMNNKQKRYI